MVASTVRLPAGQAPGTTSGRDGTMCGIAGAVGHDGRPGDGPAVLPMCDRMVHRGPDDAGLFVDADVALGARRLSIIDPPGGYQPIGNEDGSVQVVLNGDLYNFPDLRGDRPPTLARFGGG